MLRNALSTLAACICMLGCASLPERNASLWNAASRGDTAAVERLLDAGAQIDAKDRHGDTALHLALRQKHAGTSTVLIARGANPNQANVLGDTPLHLSVYAGLPELARALRSKGASDAILNQYGLKPEEMRSVPEVEAAVAGVAGLLNPAGFWIDPKAARPLFDALKARQDKYLVNAVALQVIRGQELRYRLVVLGIKLGISGSQDKLGALLMAYGDKGMAEDYLNSGSSTLGEWARKWAASNGFTVRTGAGQSRASWGSF